MHAPPHLTHSPFHAPVPGFQVVTELPEHLQLLLFSHIPLTHLLGHLPADCHPLALHAHSPSIDAAASLHIPFIPFPLVPAALRAATWHTHIHHLSLSGLTLPSDSKPCMRHLLAFTALTSLCLSNMSLRQPTAAAVAAILPALHTLLSLDLSSNLLAAPLMHALTPALGRCTALRTLNLWDTLSVAADAGPCLPPLAAALRQMPHLSSFSAGVCRWNPRGAQRLDAAGCDNLLATLHHLPALQHLRLAIVGRDAPEAMPDDVPAAPAVLDHLTQLTQLQSLFCAVPPLAATSQPSRLGAHLTALTSLHLDFHPQSHQRTAYAAAAHASALLPDLLHLHDLWLRVPIPSEHEHATEPCRTLAEVLPRMRRLTRLQLLAGEMDVYNTVVVEPGGVSIADVVEAAALLPQLRVLHVPVSAVAGVHERAVKGLLRASERVQLSLDAYVRVWDDSPLPMPAYAPLFPYARTVDLWCCAGQDELQPLAAGRGAFTQLRELQIEAVVPEDTPGDGAPLVVLLNDISCLSALECLHCAFDASEYFGDHEVLQAQLRGMSHGLRSLTRLTDLELDLGTDSEGFLCEVVQACVGLTRLQKLHLPGLCTLLPEFRRMAQQVLRKTYDMASPQVDDGDFEFASLLSCLPHLRGLGIQRQLMDARAAGHGAAGAVRTWYRQACVV